MAHALRTIGDLHDGYRRFRDGRFTEARDRYRELAERGQDPIRDDSRVLRQPG